MYTNDIRKVAESATLPDTDGLFLDIEDDDDVSVTQNVGNIEKGLIPRYSKLYIMFGTMSEKLRALIAMDRYFDTYVRFDGKILIPNVPVPELTPAMSDIRKYVSGGSMTTDFNGLQSDEYTAIAQRFNVQYLTDLQTYILRKTVSLFTKFTTGNFTSPDLTVNNTYYELYVRLRRGINDYNTSVRDDANDFYDLFYSNSMMKVPNIIASEIYMNPDIYVQIQSAITYVDTSMLLDKYKKCIVNEIKTPATLNKIV
jgi:hypothetical protein